MIEVDVAWYVVGIIVQTGAIGGIATWVGHIGHQKTKLHFDSKLDDYKKENQKDLIEYQVKLSRWNEKRSEIVSELFAETIEFHDELDNMVEKWGNTTDEELNLFNTHQISWIRSVNRKQLYLEQSSIDLLNHFEEKIRKIFASLAAYRHHMAPLQPGDNSERRDNGVKVWQTTRKEFSTEDSDLKKIMKSLKEDLKKTITPS